MITENFEFLLFFGGYFLIELVFFLILIYLLVKNRNSQEKTWLSKPWRICNTVSLLLECFIVPVWSFFAFCLCIFLENPVFYFKLNVVLLTLTIIMMVIRFIVGIIDMYRRRKYLKYKN